MAKLHILVPDAPTEDSTLERQLAGPDISFDFLHIRKNEQIPDATLAAADAVLAWHLIRYDAAMLARLPRCRAIMRSGVGVDLVDLEAAGAAGIAVLNTPDYGTGEVADHAMALLLSLRRGIASFHDRLRDDPIRPWGEVRAPLMKRMRGDTLGVVGLGRIGTAFVERARGFGFQIQVFDPYLPRGQEIALNVTRHETLQGLLAACDVISLHCPLTPETHHLFDAAAFAAMRPGSLLINTARGGIVDPDACFAALRDGHLGGAALDVLPKEPMPAEHALIAAYTAREDWIRDRLILTPHAAWYSPESAVDIRRLSIERLIGYLTRGDRSCIVNGAWLKNPR